MKFDELNALFVDYFDIMKLSEEDKKNRVDCAMWLYDAVWYIFTLIRMEFNNSMLYTKEEYTESLMMRVEEFLRENNIPYNKEYLKRVAEDIINTTFRHLGDEEEIEEEDERLAEEEEDAESEEDEEYYLSEERAILIAKNEANSIYNYRDYVKAKEEKKQYKVWYSEGDDRVRYSHFLVDGMRIPIEQPFPVGDDLMMFPHDYMNGSPENLINCRCSCFYE